MDAALIYQVELYHYVLSTLMQYTLIAFFLAFVLLFYFYI